MTHIILSNWALCSLLMNAFHDALAASAVSIQTQPKHKAIVHICKSITFLGAPDKCLAVMEKFKEFVGATATEQPMKNMSTLVVQLFQMLTDKSISNAGSLLKSNQSLFCNWCRY